MNKASIDLLRALTQADAISGHEAEVREIFQSQLEGIGILQKDRLGSIFCTKRGRAEPPRILLDSHIDEVGFIVQSVTSVGYVKFIPVGGWWARTVASVTEPDVAIVLEGPPADDTPGVNSDAMQGKLGGGVQIRLYDPTMIANPRLCDLVIETAKAHQISHQIAVRHSGGTDAGAIHQVGNGVPS
ncbi:M42 family peptidase, partial [Candidatus Poribacteria bacterium]|nr:M42 family peptidase [Candidatus Poribacteria bacterium]